MSQNLAEREKKKMLPKVNLATSYYRKRKLMPREVKSTSWKSRL